MPMTTVLCTLYNSLYLDKGLVLYDSLCACAKDFKLYVLCMDDRCYEVLMDLNQDRHIPVRLVDFEEGDEDLLIAKGNRPVGEYCWTCSSSFIRYVLKRYNEPICTYIDADMYFYTDPQILVDEMLEAGKSVMVTPHRFPAKDEKQAEIVGTYCVEFNTFRNTSDSLEVLEYWRNRCLECCTNLGDGIHWGDQKYLEELVDRFSNVYVCKNNGAGVAPWNIVLYSSPVNGSGMSMLRYNTSKEDIPLFFYHFQSVKYIDRHEINTGVFTHKGIDYDLVDSLYYPYLRNIEEKKKYLESNYNIDLLIKKHPTDKNMSLFEKVLYFFSIRRQLLKLKLNILNIHPYIIKI